MVSTGSTIASERPFVEHLNILYTAMACTSTWLLIQDKFAWGYFCSKQPFFHTHRYAELLKAFDQDLRVPGCWHLAWFSGLSLATFLATSFFLLTKYIGILPKPCCALKGFSFFGQWDLSGSALQKWKSIFELHSFANYTWLIFEDIITIADVIPTWEDKYLSEIERNQLTSSNHHDRILCDIICATLESKLLHA